MARKSWTEKLDAAIFKKFGVKTETTFNIFAFRHVTSPADGKTPLTDEIHAFIREWMDQHAPA